MWSAGNHGRINRLKGHGVIHQPIPLGVRWVGVWRPGNTFGAFFEYNRRPQPAIPGYALNRSPLCNWYESNMWWHTVVHIFPLGCQWFVFVSGLFSGVCAIKLENRWIIESLILIITTGIQSDSVSRVEMKMWCLEADRNQYDYLANPGPTENLVMAFPVSRLFSFSQFSH